MSHATTKESRVSARPGDDREHQGVLQSRQEHVVPGEQADVVFKPHPAHRLENVVVGKAVENAGQHRQHREGDKHRRERQQERIGYPVVPQLAPHPAQPALGLVGLQGHRTYLLSFFGGQAKLGPLVVNLVVDDPGVLQDGLPRLVRVLLDAHRPESVVDVPGGVVAARAPRARPWPRPPGPARP